MAGLHLEYRMDEPVWVKVPRMPWWPGIVVDPCKHFAEHTLSRKPLVAMVNFPPFHNLKPWKSECVRDPTKIYPFQCEKKDFFISQGKKLYQVKNLAQYSTEFSQSLEYVSKLAQSSNRTSSVMQGGLVSSDTALISEEDGFDSDSLPDISTAQNPAPKARAAQGRGLQPTKAKPWKSGHANPKNIGKQSCRKKLPRPKFTVGACVTSTEPLDSGWCSVESEGNANMAAGMTPTETVMLSSPIKQVISNVEEMTLSNRLAPNIIGMQPSTKATQTRRNMCIRSRSCKRSATEGACISSLQPHGMKPSALVAPGTQSRSLGDGHVTTLQPLSAGVADLIKHSPTTAQAPQDSAITALLEMSISGSEHRPSNSSCQKNGANLIVQPQRKKSNNSLMSNVESNNSPEPFSSENYDQCVEDVILPDISQPIRSRVTAKKRRKKNSGSQVQQKRKCASRKSVTKPPAGDDVNSLGDGGLTANDDENSVDLHAESRADPLPSTSAVADDSDEDDDLPDVLGMDVEATDSELRVGDMVWVKYRTMPHWPALVQTLYKKVKKVTVIFICESPEQACSLRMTLTKKSVVLFSSQYSQFKFFKDEGLKSVYAKTFEKSIDRVDSFFISNGLGAKQTAAEFFAEDLLSAKGMPSSSVMGEQLCSTPPPSDAEEDHHLHLPQGTGREEEEEETQEEEAESQGTLKKMARVEHRHEKRKEKNGPLIDFIKAEKCQSHLSKVFLGKVKNLFHDTFLNSPRGKVPVPGFGPVDDDDQLLELMEVMHKLQRREKPEMKLPETDYILYVLIPEAIVYALIHVRAYSRGRAVEFLAKGAYRTKEESQLLHQQLMRAHERQNKESYQEDENE